MKARKLNHIAIYSLMLRHQAHDKQTQEVRSGMETGDRSQVFLVKVDVLRKVKEDSNR